MMINLPIFDRLDIEDYGLFPGDPKGERGLHIQFLPGLTLILGANGLGKTTLVAILYRMLAGPFDIPGLTSGVDLGSIRLEPTQLPVSGRKMFAQRVADGARSATARLSFSLGSRSVVVARRLSDLALTQFTIDDREFAKDERSVFQAEIPKLVGVWSFGDWILVLRHLVFYFEDRRALVWDASAQRQILRLLLLPAETARKWSEDERTILERDSQARNLSSVVYREEQVFAETQVKVEKGADVRAELKALEGPQLVDTAERERLDSEFVEAEGRRQAARLRMLKAEQERETRYRDLERAKLTAIEARFPTKSDTARYILAQLMTSTDCLVCGSRVPGAAAALQRRIAQERCVVCGSDLSPMGRHVSATKVADRRVQKAAADLATFEAELTEARQQLQEVEKEHAALVYEIARLDAKVAERSARMDALIRRLPPAEAELHQQRAELAAMRSRLETRRKELTEKRKAFAAFVDAESRAMVVRSQEIQTSFEGYARGFLIEKCRLVWSPQRARVGQTGDLIEFHAFELELTGADFPSPVRRTGPEEVSESQREFIDLAFRMSLMEIAGSGGIGSLIIDAPESSLDAVFVTRAANVLARFAEPKRGNRLAVTSNLIEGKLIPSLLRLTSTPDDRITRLVDLFKIAEPTAAIREMRGEYESILKGMLASIANDQTRGSARAKPSTRNKRK